MKTFKDLTFEPHPNVEGGKSAVIDFDNGRAISVITGADCFQTSDDKPYEVAFRTKDGRLGCVYLDRGSMSVSLLEDEDHTLLWLRLLHDVVGYCTEDDVTLIMKAIQIL